MEAKQFTLIEAARLAVEALEKIDGAMPFPVGQSAITALRAAIAEAEKKEAAERYVHQYRCKPHPGDFGIPRGYWWRAKQYADVLYTTPPPADHVGDADKMVTAQRQPLTDEQMKLLWAEYGYRSAMCKPFARAIEAAHGIK